MNFCFLLVKLRSSPRERCDRLRGPNGRLHFPGSVSAFLLQWAKGDSKALEALTPLVYDELRPAGRYHLQRQRLNHTIPSADLVNEIYLRLADEKSLQVVDRAHFVSLAAQLMRWILVDYERNRGLPSVAAGKRGSLSTPASCRRDRRICSMWPCLPLTKPFAIWPSSILSRVRSSNGEISIEETAEVLQTSSITVKHRWASARDWFRHETTRSVHT